MKSLNSRPCKAFNDFSCYIPTSLLSRQKRRESNLWQRRFWEHLIRDERDYALHDDYIHYNPVKHGLCLKPQDWLFSSIHRFIAQGLYPPDWGMIEIPIIPDNIGDE